MKKTIPATTDEACKQYKTKPGFCMCDDFGKRQGGSYVLHGIQVCKHVAHIVNTQGLVPNPDYDPFAAFNCDTAKYSCEWMPAKEPAHTY